MAAAASNTESASLCKRCKSKVVNGFKCIKCNSLFHPSCAKLNEVKFLDKTVIDCCATVKCDSDTAFFDALDEISDGNKKVDINIFQYVIKQKDSLINELYDKIRLLNNQIDFLSKNKIWNVNNDTKKEEHKTIKLNPTADKCVGKKEVYTLSDKAGDKKPSVSSHSINKPTKSNNSSVITNTQVAAGIMNANQQVSLNKYINLTKEDGSSNSPPSPRKDDRWQEVKKKRRRPFILGKNHRIGT